MSLFDTALRNAGRGWKVFPCKPRDKKPLTVHGFKDATTDESQIREWWTTWPSANVAIATGDSGVTVLDIDVGLADLEAFQAWRTATGLPDTFTVHTGRRPDFGAQLYFTGTMQGCDWELNGCKGQIKSLGGYVMAAGSLHPSGEAYEVISDVPLAPVPELLHSLGHKAQGDGKRQWALPVHDGEYRRGFMVQQGGRLREVGLGKRSSWPTYKN